MEILPSQGLQYGMDDVPLLNYDYRFWIIQPDGFSPSNGATDNKEDLPEVCGFFMQYFMRTIAPFVGSYALSAETE